MNRYRKRVAYSFYKELPHGSQAKVTHWKTIAAFTGTPLLEATFPSIECLQSLPSYFKKTLNHSD